MNIFDQVRRKRASRLKIISSVPAEELKNLGDKLKEHDDERISRDGEAERMRERLLRELGQVKISPFRSCANDIFRYSIFEKCEQVLREGNFF